MAQGTVQPEAGGSHHRPPLISEDDRDTAVQRLQEAYAQGHISHEDLDERLHQALTAKTHSELVQALASLPEENAGTTSTIAAVSGRIQRRGAWRIPRILKVESAFGRVHLDLSRAVIDHPVVDIEVQLGTGSAKTRCLATRSSTSRICTPGGRTRATSPGGAPAPARRGSGSPGPWGWDG